MQTNSENIGGVSTVIEPIQVKPPCDILTVMPGRTSTIPYVVGKLIPGVAGVVGKGRDLITGADAVVGVVPIPDALEIVDQGTIEMTDEEWQAWGAQDDNEYRTAIVAKHLGLKAIKPFVPTA